MTDWDARYAEPGWTFGTEPNDFLREQAHLLPPGNVLCLADGEGRNGVWLAEQGYHVTSLDLSTVGLEKARRLAAERGVRLTTVRADLEDHVIEPGAWQGIVSIFAHVSPEIRRRVHAAVVQGLAPGGVFLLEAYRPEQIGKGTGGPPDEARMVNLERLRPELGALEWLVAREVDRDMHEGHRHQGSSSVVQLAARRRG
jgi:SAM-dependent methyltransferase